MSELLPRLEYRAKQPFVAIRTKVPIPFGTVLPELWAKVTEFLNGQGIPRSGPPFIRYLTTDMSKKLDVEVGFPVLHAVAGEGDISAGLLPAGRYAVLRHTGPYTALQGVTAGLLEWAKKENVVWKTACIDEVEWWAGRVELYTTEPDPAKWETELAFLTDERVH